MDDLSLFAPSMQEKLSPEGRLTALHKAECLQRTGIFSEVAVEQLFQVTAVARQAEFARGEFIFREGDPADAFYVIVDGEVELRSTEEVQVAGSGRSFGLYAVLAREPRRVSASTRQATLVLTIAAEDLYSVLSDNTEIVAGVLRYVARRCLKPCD
jgi:CRP-like cAMP-binding protein